MVRHTVLAFVVAFLLARPNPLTADDPTPALPQPDFSGAVPCAVVDVGEATQVTVRCDSQELRLDLIGVARASDGAAGEQARAGLERMLLGEWVHVLTDGPGSARGVPAYVWRAPDGLFVNLELVRQGYAKANGSHPHVDLFQHYERIARQAEKGIWGRSAPVKRTQLAAGPAERPASEVASGGTMVYVTRTGTKYHRQDCPHAQKSGRPLALRDAAKRYEPCKRCDPPVE